MKVTRAVPQFAPVVVTLQSAAEVGILMAVIGPTSAHGRTRNYLERASTHPDYPPIPRAALEEASDALSGLYVALKGAFINEDDAE